MSARGLRNAIIGGGLGSGIVIALILGGFLRTGAVLLAGTVLLLLVIANALRARMGDRP